MQTFFWLVTQSSMGKKRVTKPKERLRVRLPLKRTYVSWLLVPPSIVVPGNTIEVTGSKHLGSVFKPSPTAAVQNSILLADWIEFGCCKPSLYTTLTWNCLFSLFIEEKRRRISLSACFLKNSTQEEFPYIRRSGRVAIIALKFQRTRSHFFKKSDPIAKFLPPSPS